LEKGKPVTLCTLLAAATAQERDVWVKSISAAMQGKTKKPALNAKGTGFSVKGERMAPGGKSPASAKRAPAPKGPAVVGSDVAAGSLQGGATQNLKQMAQLDPETLGRPR
jgi:hypothetical protein